jgi:hypothetical protein
LWYRGHYLHGGSVKSLEELCNPKRPDERLVSGGQMPLEAKTHAIAGHEFGLDLESDE